jgi:hypothetical protein
LIFEVIWKEVRFLNDILNFTGLQAIQEVESFSNIQDPDIAAVKQSIVDILCRASQGLKYIIKLKTKLYGLSPQTNYTLRAAAASRRS